MPKDLFDLQPMDWFMWNDEIYVLVDISTDVALSRCIAQKNEQGELYTVYAMCENFDPYCNKLDVSK